MQASNTKYSWWTPIDKLTFWKAGSWIKYDNNPTKSLILRIHYDQIIITCDNKILESLNMSCKIKGIYKDDVLILIVSAIGQEIRKIKCQIKNNSKHYFKKLGDHFPVTSHNSSKIQDKIIYRSLQDIFKLAINENASKNCTALPSNYEDFVKVCLLDPTFPGLVQETQKIVKKITEI